MNIFQKCEGDSSSGGVVGHAERGDAVGALGVEDVAVLRVGDVAVGAAVGEALEDLARDGVQMAVLTNKPVRISGRILDGLGMSGYFARVYGGNSFEQKKPHPVGVDTLLAELSVPRERALVVGDSAVDVRTARNAGVKVCGVSYGLQPETFEDDPPDMIVDRLEELARAVIEERRIRGALKS